MTADDRRAQLVHEAMRLISEAGFRQFTIAELARACGISRAGVLHHFGSREDLLLEVLSAREANDAAAVLEASGTHEGDIRAMLDVLIRRNMSQPELIRLYTVLSAESLDPDHPAHEYFAQRWERTIAALASVLEGFDRPPREMAIAIHVFQDGLQEAWLRDPTVDFGAQWTAFADDLFSRHSVDFRGAV